MRKQEDSQTFLRRIAAKKAAKKAKIRKGHGSKKRRSPLFCPAMNQRIIQILRKRFAGNKRELARQIKIPTYTIQHICDLDQNPPLNVIMAMREKLGISLDYLFGYDARNSKDDLDVEVLTPDGSSLSRIQLASFAISAKAADCFCLQVADDTAAPLVGPTALVLIDRSADSRDTPGLWAVKIAGLIALRRIKVDIVSKTITVASENKEHGLSDQLPLSEVEVLGRAIWSCSTL